MAKKYIATNIAPLFPEGACVFKDIRNEYAAFTKTGRKKAVRDSAIMMAVLALPKGWDIFMEDGEVYFLNGKDCHLVGLDDGEFIFAVEAGNQREAVYGLRERSRVEVVAANVAFVEGDLKGVQGTTYIKPIDGTGNPREQYTRESFTGLALQKECSIPWEENEAKIGD